MFISSLHLFVFGSYLHSMDSSFFDRGGFRSVSLFDVFKQTFVTNLRGFYGIDYRAIGVFRILTGLLVVTYFVHVVLNFSFYRLGVPTTPGISGVVPFSIIVVTALIFGLLYLIGYYARFAAGVMTVLLSLFFIHIDLGFATSAYYLMNFLFLLAVFLPVSNRYGVLSHSISQDVCSTESSSNLAFKLSGFLLSVQLAIIYFSNYLSKSGSTWEKGTALHNVLSTSLSTNIIGRVSLQILEPIGMLPILSKLWFVLIFTFPVVLFTSRWLRVGLVGLYIGGHSVILTHTTIIVFPIGNISALFLLLPSTFFDKIEQTSLFTIIHQHISYSMPSLSVVFGFYSLFNQYSVKSQVPRMNRVLNFLSAVFVLSVIIILLIGGVYYHSSDVGVDTRDVPVLSNPSLENAIYDIDDYGYGFSWGVYSNPRVGDAWSLTKGKLVNGAVVDAYYGGGASFAPVERDTRFNGDPYLGYFNRLKTDPGRSNSGSRDYSVLHQPYATYICNEWNSNHPSSQRLESIEYYTITDTDPSYDDPYPFILGRHDVNEYRSQLSSQYQISYVFGAEC